jgi:N-acetylmuramoyl-L-alanine amidase
MKKIKSKIWMISPLLISILLIVPLLAQAATVLEVGSSGSDVVKVQKRLIQYDYLDGVADGKYGADTQAAVRLFQKRNGLAVDGRVGPSTAAALGVTLSGSTSKAASSSRSARGGSSDLNLLARVVHGEARGEPYKGKVAVAAVVLNRVKSSSFPNTIAGVVYQSGAFSAVNDGQINLTPDSESIRAARDAMNGWDPTGGCLYYYNPKTAADPWIRTRTVKTVIGRHSFAV